MSALGDNIRKLREAAGLTQPELASLAEVGQAAISKWERGKQQPSVDSLVRIAAVLGQPIDAFLVNVSKKYEAIRDPKPGSDAHRALLAEVGDDVERATQALEFLRADPEARRWILEIGWDVLGVLRKPLSPVRGSSPEPVAAGSTTRPASPRLRAPGSKGRG